MSLIAERISILNRKIKDGEISIEEEFELHTLKTSPKEAMKFMPQKEKTYYFQEVEKARVEKINRGIEPQIKLIIKRSRQSYNSQQHTVRVESDITIERTKNIGWVFANAFNRYIENCFHYVKYRKMGQDSIEVIQYYHPYSYCVINNLKLTDCWKGFSMKHMDRMLKDYNEDVTQATLKVLNR